ncbi:unnamed protein product [Psylliodes chrysocephalus]|uniref:Uncharacterized protein n=1 Tax=Psylliodes chrysocephalus TaxID=3402493 RepID=A0A9P0G4D4_9CUCU|nr:unnamed protein product [Psylliodes chrysocephala]
MPNTRNKFPESVSDQQQLIEGMLEKHTNKICERLEKQMDKLYNKFENLELKLKQMEDRFENFDKEINENISNIKETNKKLENVYKIQQKNTLRVDGIPKTNGEDVLKTFLKIVSDKLKIQCEDRDINDIYRIGKTQQKGRIRTVIIQFVRPEIHPINSSLRKATKRAMCSLARTKSCHYGSVPDGKGSAAKSTGAPNSLIPYFVQKHLNGCGLWAPVSLGQLDLKSNNHSAQEFGPLERLLEYLTSHQLRGPAEIRLLYNERLGPQYETKDNIDVEPVEPQETAVSPYIHFLKCRRNRTKLFLCGKKEQTSQLYVHDISENPIIQDMSKCLRPENMRTAFCIYF